MNESIESSKKRNSLTIETEKEIMGQITRDIGRVFQTYNTNLYLLNQEIQPKKNDNGVTQIKQCITSPEHIKKQRILEYLLTQFPVGRILVERNLYENTLNAAVIMQDKSDENQYHAFYSISEHMIHLTANIQDPDFTKCALTYSVTEEDKFIFNTKPKLSDLEKEKNKHMFNNVIKYAEEKLILKAAEEAKEKEAKKKLALKTLGGEILEEIQRLKTTNPNLVNTLEEIEKAVSESMETPSTTNSATCIEKIEKAEKKLPTKLKGILLCFAGVVAIIGSLAAIITSWGIATPASMAGISIGAGLITAGGALLGVKGVDLLSQASEMNKLRTHQLTTFKNQIKDLRTDSEGSPQNDTADSSTLSFHPFK